MEMIDRGAPGYHDWQNGTLNTLAAIQDIELDPKAILDDFTYFALNYDKRWKELVDNMLDYYETPHHVFVHGWFPYWIHDWRKNANKKDWYKSRWENGMEHYLYDHSKVKGKQVVCRSLECIIW